MAVKNLNYLNNFYEPGFKKSGGSGKTYTFNSPLIEENTVVSFDSILLDKWNGYEAQINENKSSIENINQSLSLYATVGFVNNELSKYVNKEDYDSDKSSMDAKITNNKNEITDLTSRVEYIETEIQGIKTNIDEKLDVNVFNEYKTQVDEKNTQQDTLINENTTNIATKLDTSAFETFKQEYDTKQQEQDNVINQKANTSDLEGYATKQYVDNSLVGKQDILMWKNKVIKNIVFEDSQVCIDWLNDNNSRIKVISYRGFGVHQGGYGTPIPWNYSTSERLWIQFNPNTGKWYWSESTNFIARNMYVLIIEYVEM